MSNAFFPGYSTNAKHMVKNSDLAAYETFKAFTYTMNSLVAALIYRMRLVEGWLEA